MRDASFYLYDTTYFDWDQIEKYDNWLYIFDHLPNRMRLYVDLRISHYQPRQIALMCDVQVKAVKKQLGYARTRFLRGANLI